MPSTALGYADDDPEDGPSRSQNSSWTEATPAEIIRGISAFEKSSADIDESFRQAMTQGWKPGPLFMTAGAGGAGGTGSRVSLHMHGQAADIMRQVFGKPDIGGGYLPGNPLSVGKLGHFGGLDIHADLSEDEPTIRRLREYERDEAKQRALDLLRQLRGS